eukprot:6263760-Amphidinium_carterae.1
MATTTVGVATVVHSGKQDAGHFETFATGMDFEDKFTTTNQHFLAHVIEGYASLGTCFSSQSSSCSSLCPEKRSA